MSITEAVIEKLAKLPQEQQKQVLNYVEVLSANAEPASPYAFLDAAMNLRLDGPPDWSESFEGYLYGDKQDA
jgi:hypothetical protein